MSCFFTVVITISLHFLHKKRYCLKTLWYKLRYEKAYKHDNYNYNSYISYSLSDQNWTHESLLPCLEQTYGFNVCIPERNFNASRAHVDEIINSMTHSRGIIIVLSSNYLQENSCLFDLALAFEQRRRYGKRVFAVVLGNIPNSVLRRHVTAAELIDSGRCVEWPVSARMCSANGDSAKRLVKKRAAFWCKLSTEIYRSMCE